MNHKHLVVGVLAHVDAGKTTLAEGIMYLSGSIRKMGRVDHKDAFLDTFDLERSRGITIFSKQAEFSWLNKDFTLLDTPGHIDFSAEMERTLQVLDYAILVISCLDGIQGHVLTLWKLLKHYQIPTFLFINKMDQPGADKAKILHEIQKRLDECCIDFSSGMGSERFLESMASCNEMLLEKYVNGEDISFDDISQAILKLQIFPCYFGSALKVDGIDALLNGLSTYTILPEYREDFGAKIYKISRDKQGNRLTHMKITGGCLRVKDSINASEKIDQIRIYSGTNYQMVNTVTAGAICAVTGLNTSKCGQSLGSDIIVTPTMLEPVLTYQIKLPKECNVHDMLLKLRQLEEEQPELQIVWNEQVSEIHAKVMGAVQIEILKSIIEERFHVCVDFGTGKIVYKETISDSVEGCGHYEPLRHYSEVRLFMQPLERGSGLVFDSDVSEDILDKNWQRLILTHLAEKSHKGVLTGSDITDMKITLVNGRAHIKHTEGGDFRQATYRAVRQGLKKAKSVLLEPVYEYHLEVPSEFIGRAMSDIQRMHGTFEQPIADEAFSTLIGIAPVATMRDYQTEVIAYTKAQGNISFVLKGYEPCHNTEEVISSIGYDSEKDIENPTSSVFCDHGAGFVVPWDQVELYMHTEQHIKEKVVRQKTLSIDDDELEAIFTRTYGANRKKMHDTSRTIYASAIHSTKPKKQTNLTEVLLVDGYNIIFSWDDLKELANENIAAARGKLMDILCNYQGYRDNIIILVFDGYKVPGNPGEVTTYHNIYVVYTKEAETADQYIEKTVRDISRKYDVRVATSDILEQIIIMGQGARRMSAQELFEEILIINRELKSEYLDKTGKTKQYLFEGLSEELSTFMNDVRLGRKEFHEINNLNEEE